MFSSFILGWSLLWLLRHLRDSAASRREPHWPSLLAQAAGKLGKALAEALAQVFQNLGSPGCTCLMFLKTTGTVCPSGSVMKSLNCHECFWFEARVATNAFWTDLHVYFLERNFIDCRISPSQDVYSLRCKMVNVGFRTLTSHIQTHTHQDDFEILQKPLPLAGQWSNAWQMLRR